MIAISSIGSLLGASAAGFWQATVSAISRRCFCLPCTLVGQSVPY